MPPEVKIYECEVKKLFRKDGTNEWRWVVRPVKDAISDGVTQFRCKDCHGAVKLHGKNVAHGPAPHVEHKSRAGFRILSCGDLFPAKSWEREEDVIDAGGITRI